MNVIVNLGVNKVSLQSSEDGVTGGYYDGEGTYHEFGGGGGTITPLLSVKVINNTNSTISVQPMLFFKTDHVCFNDYEEILSIPSGETSEATGIIIPEYQDTGMFVEGLRNFINGQDLNSFTPSEEVNCTVNIEENYLLEITDYTKNASLTLTAV